MSSSKNFICKSTLRQMFICLRPRTPYHPPLTHCIHVYSILIHTEKGGGGELNQKEGLRGNSLQSQVEDTNMTDCIFSLLSLINTCRKVTFQVIFFR